MAKDPVLFEGGSLSLYAYAENDPLNLSDPSGLSCVSLHSSPIALKPEEGDAIWLAPEEDYEGPIDGVRPPVWGGDWLKIWPGTNVIIMPDGNPIVYGPTTLIPFVPDIPGLTDLLPGRKNPDWPQRHVE